jgi:hypothetical protein
MSIEHDEQVRFIRWCIAKKIDVVFAVPNGGYRGKREAGRLKAEGVKAGIPDIVVPIPRGGYGSLFIEMKRPGGRISPAQKAMMSKLAAVGNRCVVCYSHQEAIGALCSYLELP